MNFGESFGQERPMDQARADASWRSDAQVDADRILYSSEFRRLAGVTQVMSPQDDYVFHDRLTHSLKVAQVAATLARRLIAQGQVDGIDAEELHSAIDPEICYVAGLAHDLGHPPFGHAAEEELQKILACGKSSGGAANRSILRDSFEGNAQSFRIIALLSQRKFQLDDDFSQPTGLNLTWRSLAAISKYPWRKGGNPTNLKKLEKKWGFYDTEYRYHDELVSRNLISLTLTADGTVQAVSRSIEAEIMDWADDIAYAVHDLEDFHKSGKISLDRLGLISKPPHTTDSEYESLLDFALPRLERAPDLTQADLSDQEMLIKLIQEHVNVRLPQTPFSGSPQSQGELIQFSSNATAFLESQATVQKINGRLQLVVRPDGRIIAEFLKSLTKYYVINDSTLETMQFGQRKVIADLFAILHQMTVKIFIDDGSAGQEAKRLPARLYTYMLIAMNATGAHQSDEDRAARAVVDFICSLTDKQASFLHQRLTGNSISQLSPYWLNI